MKRKRKYPYPFPHLEFACLFVDVFQRISGVLYNRFILFKFHGLTTTFYVSLFKNSAQKILQRIIHVLIFLPSTPHDFFLMFSKHALLFRRRGNPDVFLQTRNTHFKLYYYVITFQRRDGYRVNHNHTSYVHTGHEHSGHVSLKWSAFPYRYRPTWSSSSNLDNGNFLLTCVLAGEFLGRPTFGERLI